MAAKPNDAAHYASVKLVRVKDLKRVKQVCKNPPKPSAALVQLFAAHKAKI